MPLNSSPAWREAVARLEDWRNGGNAPPPLRVNAFSSYPGISSSGSGTRRWSPRQGGFSETSREWRRIIELAGLRHGVDAALIAAVIQVESNFNPRAVSPKGAKGAMQIMPETGKEMGLREFFDPVSNTDAGTRYLAAMLREFPRLELALAAYNAGPTAVRQHGGSIPPYPETRDYVARVLSVYADLTAYWPHRAK
ncbi:MAG: lytic transglycosylase domain-containing protein [Desulfovibrio sp.]|nr:lytic transglycosylase domain-containing protein [Desulfovibrio sp.]